MGLAYYTITAKSLRRNWINLNSGLKKAGIESWRVEQKVKILLKYDEFIYETL
jgi:hypothetical protein